MIVQSKESKNQKSLIDLLGGNTKNNAPSKTNDLFSKLLSSMGMKNDPSLKDEAKVVKANDFKAVIDPKKGEIKTVESKPSQIKEELLNLLNGNEEKDIPFISKEMIGSLSNTQLKTVINEAKEYLKKEIIAKNPELDVKSETLPKTLAGLVKLAEKMGLEPTAATLTTILQESPEKESFPAELLTKPLLDAKAIAALPVTYQEESPIEAITQLLSELKGKEKKEHPTAPSGESTDAKEPETLDHQPLKALLQNIEKNEPKVILSVSNDKPTGTEENTHQLKALLQTIEKNEPKVTRSVSNEESNHGIETVFPSKTEKTDALMTLLQGNPEAKESRSSSNEEIKVDAESSAKSLHLPKADSIEVKAKEAQQSMRQFAGELKEAVQEYKPPFTRLTMKLNPEKLGEVEVTLVQRGNNVHVNIQSNNSTGIAFLAHNATELKAQLAHQGITNATMNFMSSGQEQQHNAHQQQHHQQEQRQHAFRSYESFEELELNQEQLSALEIIIPHYA